MERHKPDHEKFNEVAEKLLKVGRELKMEDDTQALEREMDDANRRWTKLNREIREKLHDTGQVEHELAEFRECVDTLQKSSQDVVNSIRNVGIFDVPEGDVVDLKSIEVKRRVSKPDDAKKDLEKVEVRCTFSF